MKLRDHKEHILHPAVRFASQAYTDLMSQFKDDKFMPSFYKWLLEYGSDCM